MHPDPAAATADVAPAGGDRVGAFDTDVGLVEVQCFPELDPAIAQTLQVELMEKREAVVHVFEGEIVCGDPRALVDLASGARSFGFHLIERGNQAAGPGVTGRVIEDVDRLLFHVRRALGRGKEIGAGHHDGNVVVEQVGGLRDPARREVVLSSKFLGPVLRPVTLREHQPVATGILHERRHHFVALAVLSAILRELQGRAVRGGTAP